MRTRKNRHENNLQEKNDTTNNTADQSADKPSEDHDSAEIVNERKDKKDEG